MTKQHKLTDIFEQQRLRLFRQAYGMLGRVAPAEDVVQEAWLRWQKQDMETIRSPAAFFSTVVHRICLDELKKARHQRERYIGPNLPEPLLEAPTRTPDEELELAESLSMAMLVILDELSPVQRAVFILRELFEYDYETISDVVNKSTAHCRKIAQRARDQIHDRKPVFERKPAAQQGLVKALLEAVQRQDLAEVEALLAEDSVLYSDGGGKVTAARKPIYGSNKIARFLVGIQKQAPEGKKWWLEYTSVNGEPGMIIRVEGQLYNVWSFHIEEQKIESIYVVLNPNKLGTAKKQLS
ncbi:RNA polymerase sigma-70 factor [Fodinibius roseus]|nr:RNA polymerase sigma-70 factor [Fodinibius roseus]